MCIDHQPRLNLSLLNHIIRAFFDCSFFNILDGMFSGTSMSSTYLPLKNEDVREQEDVEPWTTGFRRPKTFSRPMSLGIIGLIVTNVATIAYFMKPAKVIAQLEVIPLDYGKCSISLASVNLLIEPSSEARRDLARHHLEQLPVEHRIQSQEP